MHLTITKIMSAGWTTTILLILTLCKDFIILGGIRLSANPDKNNVGTCILGILFIDLYWK